MQANLVVQTGEQMVLDLSEYELSNKTAGHTIEVKAGGELLIRGTAGRITNNSNECTLLNYGTVTLEGGALTHMESAKTTGSIVENYGFLQINGGSLQLAAPDESLIINCSGARTVVSGGELSTEGSYGILNEPGGEVLFTGNAVLHADPESESFFNMGQTVINGGKVSGMIVSYAADGEKSAVIISGGKISASSIQAIGDPSGAKAEITGTAEIDSDIDLGAYVKKGIALKKTTDPAEAEVVITGGIFRQPAASAYLGSAYRQFQREDGRYGVEPLTEETAAAIVTETGGQPQYFNSLNRAILAAGAGAAVKLNADTTADLTIPAGRDIILDINDHLLIGCLTNQGANLTILARDGGIQGAPCVIDNQPGGTVTLRGGVYGAVRTQGDANLRIDDNTAINSAEGPAVRIEWEESGLLSDISIAEDASLTAPAGCHLVEISLPEGADEADYAAAIQNIPAGFLHSAANDPEKEPSCTQSGLTAGSHCTICGKVLTAQQVVPALGHTGLTLEAVVPTCTETGLTEGAYCSVCGETLTAQQIVPALGHMSLTLEAVAPTCMETGLTEGAYCSVCGETLTAQQIVPALGHTSVSLEAVAPTCTETGLTEGAYCSVCGKILTAQQIVPALGHMSVSLEAAAPTCTETGLTEGAYCSVCGEILTAQQIVPALGHMSVFLEAAAPTCTETGLTEGAYCSVCGEILTAQQAVPALGHSFGPWTVVKPASCSEEGISVRTCVRDGYTETQPIAATNQHIWAEGLTVRQPNGVEPGLRVYFCTVCNQTYAEEIPSVDAAPVFPPEPPEQSLPETPSTELPGPEEPDAADTGTPAPLPPPTMDSADVPVLPPESPVPTLPDSEAEPAAFTDIPPSAWYGEAVSYVSSHRLMTGTSSQTFSPEAKMTRAMLWTVLGRMDGADVDGTGGNWYVKAQNWSIARGISDGSRAGENMTREQLVTMLWRYAGQPAAGIELARFTDSGAVSAWAREAMEWAAAEGLIEGSGGRLAPGSQATRAEVAVILMRFTSFS